MVTEVRHYKELDIYCPQFDSIELRCTNMLLPCLHKEITFAISGPYTANRRLIPSHDRIVGWHITDGKLYEGARTDIPLDTFIYSEGRAFFYFDDFPEEKLKGLLDDASGKNGMAFQSMLWIFNGERTSLWVARKYRKYHFRALCDYQGRLCIIESREKTQAERFKDLLQEIGIRNAIHLDTGPGWQNSWWRDANGKARILHFIPFPFASNIITFSIDK